MRVIEVDEPDYEYGGLSSWVRSLFVVRGDGSTLRLSTRGRLTGEGEARVAPGPERPGKILLRLEDGERLRVVEGHPDLGENGRMTRYEVA